MYNALVPRHLYNKFKEYLEKNNISYNIIKEKDFPDGPYGYVIHKGKKFDKNLTIFQCNITEEKYKELLERL